MLKIEFDNYKTMLMVLEVHMKAIVIDVDGDTLACFGKVGIGVNGEANKQQLMSNASIKISSITLQHLPSELMDPFCT